MNLTVQTCLLWKRSPLKSNRTGSATPFTILDVLSLRVMLMDAKWWSDMPSLKDVKLSEGVFKFAKDRVEKSACADGGFIPRRWQATPLSLLMQGIVPVGFCFLHQFAPSHSHSKNKWLRPFPNSKPHPQLAITLPTRNESTVRCRASPSSARKQESFVGSSHRSRFTRSGDVCTPFLYYDIGAVRTYSKTSI